MLKFILPLLAVVCLCSTTAQAETSAKSSNQLAYIAKYKDIAMREMQRAGIPASIKLAQGLHETGAGKSVLARSANNHFGIKCGGNWKGEEYYREDDDYNSRGQLIKSCFRKYRNAEASYVAHSEFLRNPAKAYRYGALFRLDPRDYRAWAKGLRSSGYATDPRYADILIALIERYNLTQYDRPFVTTPEEVTEPVREEVSRAVTGILRTNDVTYFVSEAPVSVDEIAKQVDLSVERLLSYNEGLNKDGQQVGSGERVFLKKKRRAYRGREAYHTVKPGENLYDIAQKYGLRLKILARRNRLEQDSDPATGQRIKLRGSKVKKAPKVESGRPAATNTGTTTSTTNDGSTPPRGQVVAPRTPRPTVRPTPRTNPPTTITRPTSTNTGSTSSFHSVKAGETLYAISRRYGLTVAALKQLNGLSTNNISVGQQLKVR
ncbi:glucosaminidase domain-containing protein [Lewinella sp. 4G2]|uniref:glucosaminidase domain-containing protein n=1 Tax=Lewinella sp. 4G2 TaxID=1803372 RepID=UPI0007B46282|nr:glucosaminidase domain-containing protein [Lewinella sp. 4G2]OAV43043.1 hypothetical protein A3850_000355 [Lewinella sp. 4G2]